VWRIGDAQSCERHGQKAQIEWSVVCKEDGVRLAEEVDEVGHNLFNSGLSPDHAVGDAMHPLNVLRNGNLWIDKTLEGGQLAAVEAKAHNSDFDQPVQNGEQAGGFGIEGQKGDLGET
jgi:hypothetical protein